ncbi:uncharacterized protein BXZ73DRAFT_98119 [Epithele typhae]|uniref:uncharacterized protein n=1 Tax=Epithele typhae TaxID=378194 RepID=UPI00200765B7|nr:uncharacterized protein BXZ73DRAFT_98119 [Epithele typhae]KAH9941724.1 hypothetical protein BXZ73DRAFT_98119 [Epithele typhae]
MSAGQVPPTRAGHPQPLPALSLQSRSTPMNHGAAVIKSFDPDRLGTGSALSIFHRFRVACTLRLYIKQLRSLPPPPGLTIGALRTGYYTKGAMIEDEVYVPYPSLDHFRRFRNRAAFSGWEVTANASNLGGEPPPALPCSGADWTPMSTHGDLNRSNMTLDHHGTLWIIDRAVAGIYPRCMEHMMLTHIESPDTHPKTAGSSWKPWAPFIAGRVSRAEGMYCARHESRSQRISTFTFCVH